MTTPKPDLIKDLQSNIDEFERIVADLRKENDRLKKTNADLEKRNAELQQDVDMWKPKFAPEWIRKGLPEPPKEEE